MRGVDFHFFCEQAICFVPPEDSSLNDWAHEHPTKLTGEKSKDVDEVSAELHNSWANFLRGKVGASRSLRPFLRQTAWALDFIFFENTESCSISQGNMLTGVFSSTIKHRSGSQVVREHCPSSFLL